MKKLLVIIAVICQVSWSDTKSKSSKNFDKPTVILVSMDGFRADYFARTETPNFSSFIKNGVKASNLEPVFPSVTFVNHYTIVTGLLPAHHGIVNNSMWDPKTQRGFEVGDPNEVDQPEWWEGEPIWVTAEKQDVRSATMFWVGSSAEIAGKRPSYWMPYDKNLSKQKRVEKVLEWLDLPKEKRPRLITLYFEDADEAGHQYGPDSLKVIEAIRELDRAFGLLMQGIQSRGLEKSIYILLVSDHGMAKVDRSHRIMTRDYVKSDEAKIVGKGALSMVWPRGSVQQSTILSRVEKSSKHFRVLNSEAMEKNYQYFGHRRIAPFIFLAEPGWYFDTSLVPSIKPSEFGLHGYDNQIQDMQAVFVANGPGFLPGTQVGEVKNIDLYELIAYLLKIRPAKNDGNLNRISSTLNLKTGVKN